MKRNNGIFSLTAILLISAMISCGTEQNQAPELDVRFISNLGENPVFSWKTATQADGFQQSACQVIVSDNVLDIKAGLGNVWDTGKKEDGDPLMMKYNGKELVGGKKYFARVRVWDQDGQQGPWSGVESFVIPLDYPGDWHGGWITYDYKREDPLPIFRKSFVAGASEKIDFVRFYIAAPGFYEAYLNGEKIGSNVLDPGQTNFEDYTYYVAHDIPADKLKDENILGVMLGNGWYNQNEVWDNSMIYGQPVFSCQMVIHFRDGEKKIIASDESWVWKAGPITRSNIYGGETYDARLETDGWMTAMEPGQEWQAGVPAEIHPTMLYEQFQEPIQVMGELEVQKVIDKGDGMYILDFGQNFAGWTRLKISGEPGQVIILRHVEELDAEGNIDPGTTGIRATNVIQTSNYTCKGNGEVIWEPRFIYYGFRFVEVEGLKVAPEEDFLTGVIVHSSVPEVGRFQCSEENINQLHRLSQWTILGNIHSIPTDCPHREKCGWTGDAHAMIHSMVYNYGAQRFFNKYMFDMRSSGREEKRELYFGRDFHDRSIVMKPAGIPTMIVPGKRTSGVASPDWGTAMVQIPWYLYLYYGDRLILEDFYPDMATWVEYVHGIKEDGIIPHGLGDWCPPGGNKNKDCPVPVSSSAYHILDVSLMEKAAAILGLEEDEKYYSDMLHQLKDDFNRHFLDRETFTYGTQTADAMALDIGIVPEDLRPRVAASITRNIHEKYQGFLNTGIFGISRVFKALCENGQEEEAYRLLSKTGDRSFAFMWDHYDATTLWEVLPITDEFEDAYRGSHNHPMQAGFDAWFYSGIAGINPSAAGPGFKQIVFKPWLTRYLNSASASYESGFGTIVSEWESGEGTFTWKIVIPENAEGSIYVPTYGRDAQILLNGDDVEPQSKDEQFSLLGEYGPGDYTLKVSFR